MPSLNGLKNHRLCMKVRQLRSGSDENALNKAVLAGAIPGAGLISGRILCS
jgi:hypothetical protein